MSETEARQVVAEALAKQTADDRASEISAAFQLALGERMNQAETEKLAEEVNAELTVADVDYLVNEMIAKPDWFPRRGG